jgi:DNA repair exonuclease SbcCD ATPase subunit
MKTIEAHEQSCSQQERTVQAYLNTSCRLEDKVAELRSNIDNVRSSRVKVQLKYSGFIRMLSFAAWRLYDSVRRQRFHHTQGSVEESDMIGPLEPAQVSDNVQYDSSGVALIAVTFSVWLCALASCQVRRLRAADLGRKVSSSHLQRVVGCWTSHVKKAQRRVKFESIISRRVNLSLCRRVMRCWSGTYFTYSAFLKIRKCRAMNILRRIVQARLVFHWKRWANFSAHTRHRALILQRSGRRNRRQLIFKFLGSWYLFSKVQQHRPSGESVLLDASHCLGFPARGQDDDIADATTRLSSRAGIFEQTGTLHLLTEKEVELRDLRNQLCMRDENFARLWTALADSESQIAAIQENLSSEMALSEMDQTAALERVECLAMEKEQAEEMMKGFKASVLQLTEATEALKRDLDNARDQAAEARRELKTCKKDLQEAQMAMEKKNELIDTLRDVSTGAISADVLRDEAHAEIRNALVKHQSEACLAQLNVELEHVRAQLKARDVTERELRAVLAQRLEGDAVMELREERNVLRSELETLRRDLQASVRELEICKGLVAEPRKNAKMTLEPKKDQELLLEERLADLNAHLKEKVTEFEARAQAAEEMCNAHLASLERMQSDVKGWQSKAAEHLAAKEEAEAKAAEEISRAEERCQQLITKSQNECHAQGISAKQMLHDAQSERDEAMRRAGSAGNELQHTCMLYDQAIERAEAAEDDLQQAHQAREEEARKHEKTKAELQQAFDRERAQDEVIRTQKTSSDALESSVLEVKSTSAREAAAKDEVIRKQELKLDELKMQLNDAKAVAAKEVAAQQSRLIAASDAIEKLRKQNVQLEEELDTARLTAARASTEGAILQSSINDLSESRRQRENELLDKDEELRKLRREVAGHAALASAVEKLRRQNAQLDEELTAVRLKAEDASTEGRLLNSSLCSSTSAKQRIEHELANRSEELFKLQYQISGLSSEHESTQAKLLVSERLCQEQDGRIRALTAELQLVRVQRISDAQSAVPRRQESVLEFGTQYEDQIHTYTSHIEALKAKIVSVEEDSRRARHERDQAVLGEERARNEFKRLVNARENEVGLVKDKEGGVVMSVPNAEHEVERIQALTSEVERLRVELATAQEDALNSRHDRDSALSQNDTTKVEHVAEDQVLSLRAVPGPGQQYGRSDYDARVALTAEIQDLRRKLDDVEGGAQEARSECENAAQRENKALAELEVLRRQLAEAEGDVQQARSAHDHAVQGEKRALAELKKLSEVLQPKENVQTSKQKEDLEPANAGSGRDRSLEEGMRSKLQDANVQGRPSTSLMLNEEVGSMNSQLAASKNRQKTVDMVMKLGLNFSAAGEEGSTSRRFFEKSLVQDLANASGMAATNFKVRNMSPGSVIVDIRVFPDAVRGLDPEHVVKDLEAQADDAGSQLMNGILTRYTQSLTLSARPGSNSGFQSEQDIASPRGMYSEASQSLGVMTSAELLGNSDAEMIQNKGRMAQEMAAQNAQHFVIVRENELLVEDRQTLEEKLKVTERELAIKVGQWNELHDQVAQLAKDKKQMSSAAERDASAQAQKLIRLESELADHEVRRQNLEDQLKVAEQMCQQKEQMIHQLREKLESVQAQISASPAGQRKQVANEGSGAVAGNMLLDPDESLALLEKGHHSSMAANVKTKEPVLQFSKRRDHPEVNVCSVGQMRERQELVASEDSGEDLAAFRDNEQDVAELQAKMNECANEYATALSEKQHTVDNLLRERDVNIKELSDLRASLQDSTLALNATRRQLEHVCLERNTVDLPNTHSELEVAQQHVAELQAKLNTALSEKQHTVDNLLRERDVNIKELSDLRASLQDSTLALNATRRQLEHVCLERNTVDLPNTHSELEVERRWKEALEAGMQADLERKAADTKAAIARTIQTEEWSRILNTLRAQLDAAEAKAAAASARAASMSEIHKIQHSKWSLQSNILKAQKEEADGRAHAAEKTVEAFKNRIATVERGYVETQCQLSDALLRKTDLEANSICGETWGLQSYENLLTDLQSTRAQRDSWKRKAEAWEAGARAETERCKEQETAMQAVASVSHTLEETCKQWELVVQDLQAQRDEAEARAAAYESRACNLEATIAANTAFLEDLCGQMDTARGDYRQFWACPALGPKVGNQGSDELVANFTAHSQDWESAWNEWRFHAETISAQTEQKPETAVSSAQNTCNAYLQALRVWAGKVHVLEEARLHWQARAESLTLGRDAANSSESKSQNHEALVRASIAEMKKAQQASVQALVERVYLLEKTCIEWQWNVHNIESQTQTPSSPSHMPGCSAHEMPVRHTLHHLQSRLDSLDTAFQVSTERCQELQVKLNTLCSCIERASGVSKGPFSTSYERALRMISQLQELQESNDAFSQTAANQHFVDDGWRVAHGDERSRNSSPCCNVNAGIEALEHELLDFQAVFTEVVSKILASEEDMHTHILFLQKVISALMSSLAHVFADPRLFFVPNVDCSSP